MEGEPAAPPPPASKLLTSVAVTSSAPSPAASRSLPAKKQGPVLTGLSGLSGVVVVSAQPSTSSTLPNPPPLISVSNIPPTTQGQKGNATTTGVKSAVSLALVGQKLEPVTAQTQKKESVMAQTQKPGPATAQTQKRESVMAQTQKAGPATAQTQKKEPVAALTQKLEPVIAQTQKLEPSTAQMAGIEIRHVAPGAATSGVVKNSMGGLGAGKPKAFLTFMTSSAKKPSKKTPPSAAKANRGQGNKNKVSLTSTAPLPKKGDSGPTPSRTSNRSIKRPRTYDEECDDLKVLKPTPGKKLKGTPKVSKSLGKKSSVSTGIKDLGRWRPTDDLMLISAVQQTNDLTAVHLGVNFSCRFTLQEVEERWHALLYTPRISQLAIEAMKALHPGVVTMALNNALWSQEEEAVLARIPTTDPGHLEKFQSVLKENPAVFHTCRTATSLHHHWVLMGHNGLLNNQKVDLVPPEENIKEFADAEDRLEDSELMKHKDVREAALEQELVAADRLAKIEILKLEEEIPLWRTVIDTASPPDFGPSDFALLKGKVVEFRMTKKTVVIGRSTSNSDVDFDLSMEGPAFKISRRQASIQLTDSGEFMLHNDGRRPMYISGKAIVSKTSTKLLHNQVLEIASMSFLILLNTKLAKSSTHSTS